MSAQGSAMMVIACEHAGHTILNLTFGPEVAGDRALRMVLPIAERANQCMPIQELVTRSYCRPDSSGRLPRGLPSGSVAFMVHDNSGIHFSDTIEAASATQTARSRWCILDVRVANPSRIIPATILVPYAHQPTRLNSELDRTDMLPLWFWQTSGTLGVRINSTTFDCLPDKPTRVEASSLKVAICWRNYETVEKQIQLRTKPNPGQARVNVTLRRLAFLIAGAVRNAMSDCETSNQGRIDWLDRRWRIGTHSGYISVNDVIILGIVYVSPGRVMPLLQLRPDFVMPV